MTAAITRTPAEIALGEGLLPNSRMEDWRWTNLRTLIDKPYPPRQTVAASADAVDRLVGSSPFAGIAATRMVFVNGQLDHVRSRLANAVVEAGVFDDEPVLQMNAVLASDGAHLKLEGTADTPVELVFVATAGAPRAIALRNVIEIAAGAAATVIETHVGEGDYLANSVTEIRLGDGARLDRVKIEREAAEAIHLSHVHVTLGARAVLRDVTVTAGARLNRQNGTYIFNGKDADAKIAGAYLLAGRQHADTRLLVEHRVPSCVSRELFKCVMDDSARGIFQGKVVVARGAQKTDGKQSSHGLLLSPTAEFDAKPELEIFADDVACGHGATSGDLNHDYLFYLMSRGIPETEAKALLIAAFVGEVFDVVEHEGLRAALVEYAGHYLGAHRGGR